MKMDNTEYAYKEMEKNIALEEETIKQNLNMSKKYSQMLAAMLARLSSAVMPPLSTASLTRMATCTASIAGLALAAMCLTMAMWNVSSSSPPRAS